MILDLGKYGKGNFSGFVLVVLVFSIGEFNSNSW